MMLFEICYPHYREEIHTILRRFGNLSLECVIFFMIYYIAGSEISFRGKKGLYDGEMAEWSKALAC